MNTGGSNDPGLVFYLLAAVEVNSDGMVRAQHGEVIVNRYQNRSFLPKTPAQETGTPIPPILRV